MVKLNFIIFCDEASFDPAEKLIMKGVFDIIKAVDFPAVHNKMSVVIEIEEIEEGVHSELFKIKKNDWEVKTEVQIKKEKKGKHLFIHNFSDIRFLEEGEYDVEVYIDHNLIGSRKLVLKKA